jgi:hypothetical protein
MSSANHRLGSSIKAVLVLVFLALAIWIVLNRQFVLDEINYLQYKPSTLITSFADKTAMNSEGKFLFYSAKPALQDRAQFNVSCPSYSADTAILGCYDGQEIYIYDVTNPQLDGIREETAAYEMLHAAYKRLSPSDLKTVNTLVEAEYAKQSTADTDSSVAYFAKYEPGQRDDELFSIVATQDATISPQLETYYSRYFTNRQVLVQLYNKYEGVFNALKTQSQTLSTSLSTLSKTIDTESKQYTIDSAALSSDIDAFNTKANNGGFSSQAEFDNERAGLVARTNQLEARRTALNSDIATYNSELSQYNALAIQTQTLQNSIDSKVQPAPSL